MANINWTAAREIIGNCDGWTFIDHKGSAFHLDEVICDRDSRTVVIYFTEKGMQKQIVAEEVPALVEAVGEPTYEIIGVLAEGNTKRGPTKVRFVHAERAYAQTVAAEKRLHAAMVQLDATLISLSNEGVVVMMANHHGIKCTATSMLVIGSETIDLRSAGRLSVDTKYESITPVGAKPSLRDRLYSAMKAIGATVVAINPGEVKVGFARRPGITINANGRVKLGREYFDLHGRDPLTVHKES